ncbi:fimbrial protein [Paraburkholderia sediminicola]|uniref:fimbrial protein n=1 Tax=Paraburkholderia sediminicola TaxID=458836 RepID=UPI0038B7E518
MQVTSKEATMKSNNAKRAGSAAGAASIGARTASVLGEQFMKGLCAGLLLLGSMHACADSVHIPYARGWTDDFYNQGFSASFSPSRDLPIGTVIQSVQVQNQMTYNATCTVTKTVTVNGTPVAGMTGTYQTNVPGIGVQFYLTSGWGASANPLIQAPSSETLAPGSSTGQPIFYTRTDLVVTGPVGNGTLTTLPSLTLQYSGDCLNDPAKPSTSPHSLTLNPGTVITGRTCSVTTPSLNVTLPPISADGFATIGSAKGTAPVNLGLNCSEAGINVNITLTDASDVSNQSTTLGLASGSSAAGVGLQILNGTKPVAFGPDSALAGNLNQWLVGKSSVGAMSIPLTVRYIRTTGALTLGTVKGAATFTMSYQ